MKKQMQKQARQDVADMLKPRYPDDADYMKAFNEEYLRDPGNYNPLYDVVDYYDETPL